MLVLTRKVGEQICLPQLDVVLTVVAVEGRRVRLGVAAPREISVLRKERRKHPADFRHRAASAATDTAGTSEGSS